MECMEAKKALKSSFFSEFGMKSANPQGFCDDLWCVAGINGVLPAEDFSVDEFFDLSGEDFKDAAFLEKEIEEEEKDAGDGGRSDSGTAVSCAVSGDELSIPADDLQELELWSHLMDDSVSELPPAYPVTDIHLKTGICQENRFEPVMNPLLWRAAIPTAFPVRPRTKRPRKTPGRFLSDSSSSSGLSSPVSTLFRSGPVHEIELLYGVIKPGLKKPKKKPVETGGTRRCSHCQVTKTPQWRAGPMGPKSLCNACGVRFKSGRLFPEYRPACSPTFSTGVHSNSHRKVLEMRKKKEMVESRMDLGSVISSC